MIPAPEPPPDVWSDPCSVCGADVTGWSSDREMIEVLDELVPLWPGGPLVSVPLTFPKLMPGATTYTVHPCGHIVPTIRIYSREPL